MEPLADEMSDEGGCDGDFGQEEEWCASAKEVEQRLAAGDAVAESIATGEAAEAQIQDADEFSLGQEFYNAYKKYRELLHSEDKIAEESDLRDLSVRLKAIAYFVSRLRLFSPNEELEDISTGDLKFLLVPFLLAEVTAATRDMEERLQALKQALIFWRAFVHDCERLKIVHRDDLVAIERDPEARLDAATKRTEKIERHKRSKELDAKAAYLFEQKRKAVGDEYQWGAGGNFDEEMERDLVLALLGRAVAACAENISSAYQELPLLEMMMARGGPSAKPPKREPPAEKPWVVKIQDKHELTRMYHEMVFQCPFAQPTMSLAEAADIEMEQMRSQEERKSITERRQRYDDDDRWYGGDRYGSKEDYDDDKAAYKARDWDDWKDEHPRGSGNKMRNVS